MADTLTDLLQAVDTYMATHAKNKTTGPYLASKVEELFENPDSIFNANGVVAALSEKLSDAITAFGGELSTLKGKFVAINKIDIKSAFNNIKGTFKPMQDSINNFSKNLDSIGTTMSSGFGNSTLLANFNKTLTDLNSLDLSSQFKKLLTSMTTFSKTLDDVGLDIKNIQLPSPDNNFRIPDSLSERGRERVLDSDRIMDANIVSVDDKALNKLSKGQKGMVGGIIAGLYSSGEFRKSGMESEKKGFIGRLLSSIWGIIKSILFIFGGLFLLGKIKKFLDETPLGQKIKADIKTFGSYLFKKVTDYIKSGDFQKTIIGGIRFVILIIKKLFQGLMYVWNADKTVLKKIWDDMWNTVRDEIVLPFWENLAKPFFQNVEKWFDSVDWENLGSELKKLKDKIIGALVGTFDKIDWSDFWKDFRKNIIDPIWNSIAKSFEEGDSEEGWAKILGITALALVIGGKMGLVGLLGSVVVGLGSMARMLMNPVGGVLVALGFLAVAINKAWKVGEEAKENAEVHKKLESVATTQQVKIEKRLEELEKKKTQLPEVSVTMKDEAEKKINEAQINIEKLRLENEKQNIELNKRSAEQNEKIEDASKIAGTPVGAITATIAGWKLNKIQKESEEQMKIYQEEYNRNYELIDYWKKKIVEQPNTPAPPIVLPTPQRLDDGVVMVQPHRDDQGVVFGKENGPFSIANKESLKKLDALTQVFAEGVTMIMQASMQGSQQIVGAIAATANTSSPATTGGGMNHVGAYRDRVNRALSMSG